MHLATEVDPTDVYPSLTPLSWPEVSALPLAAILLGVLPGYLTPPPPPSEEPAAPPSEVTA